MMMYSSLYSFAYSPFFPKYLSRTHGVVRNTKDS